MIAISDIKFIKFIIWILSLIVLAKSELLLIDTITISKSKN